MAELIREPKGNIIKGNLQMSEKEVESVSSERWTSCECICQSLVVLILSFPEFLNMGGRRQSLELEKDTSLYQRQSKEARALARQQHQ